MSDTPSDTPPRPASEAPGDEEIRRILAETTDRLHDKVAVVADPEDDDDAPAEIRPPKDPNVVWQAVPSVPDQLIKFPHTVRTGPQTDAVFNLSVAAERDAFNVIQAQATDNVNGQTSVIHQLTKEFHQGQFFALVTYSRLFFQKLH